MSEGKGNKKRKPATKRRRTNWWRARAWHRWTGAILTIPLLWMAVSGLLLNNSERLGLDRASARSGWVLKRYGLVPAGKAEGVTVGTRNIAGWDGMLFLDETLLEESGDLVGAVGVAGDLVVGTGEALYVYGPEGTLADVLDELSLPAMPVKRIGTKPDGALVVDAGGSTWLADGDFLEFIATGVDDVTWSEVAEVDSGRLEGALAEGAGIPWSRVVLDLHSGNLFGKSGRFLVDVTAIGLIVMTFFGIKLLFKGMR
ncbi:MAG: hypothetical protein HKN82_10560 [Akkermansiaceae bacterium]|nr:hypothetical protein [Akkermansiaceae bacterium]